MSPPIDETAAMTEKSPDELNEEQKKAKKAEKKKRDRDKAKEKKTVAKEDVVEVNREEARLQAERDLEASKILAAKLQENLAAAIAEMERAKGEYEKVMGEEWESVGSEQEQEQEEIKPAKVHRNAIPDPTLILNLEDYRRNMEAFRGTVPGQKKGREEGSSK